MLDVVMLYSMYILSLGLVGEWYEANDLVVNNLKSGVLHVRPRRKQRP